MCLWYRTYFKLNCYISGKEFNVSNAGFYCHLKVKLFLYYQTLSLLSNSFFTIKLFLYYQTRVIFNGCIM